MARPTRSISVPITLASIAVGLSIALLIGWILVIYQNLVVTRQVTRYAWLLIAGVVSLAYVMTVMILFSVFLVREMLLVRKQNSFIDSVTHELKSPLASLRLCLDTLDREGLKVEQRQEVRGMMVDAVDRLSGFIDDVLEASHLAHGRAGHALTAVPLGAMLARCAAFVATRYKLAEGTIVIEVPEVRLMTDVTAAETVFKNLLDNAVKYSDPPIDVRVSAKLRGERIVVEVTDRGIGIPKAELRRVFDRFYRANTVEVKKRHGTGLGLFVVAALVRNLGGRLEVNSDGPGTGTTARVTLPLETEEPAPARQGVPA